MATKRGVVIGGTVASVIALASTALVRPWEGYSPTPYIDMVGVATYCYGDTSRPEKARYTDTKEARAANVRQAKRYAERWCAARLYPELPLREAVARLTDSTPIQLPPPLPGLPPTREQQQQARRLAEAGAKEIERIKAALEPRKPPAETKPRARDIRSKAWLSAGLRQLRRGV